MYKNNTLLRGRRNHQIKLWYFSLVIENEYEPFGDYKIKLLNNVY